nr:hypothetical protein [Providencia rustigianii]
MPAMWGQEVANQVVTLDGIKHQQQRHQQSSNLLINALRAENF